MPCRGVPLPGAELAGVKCLAQTAVRSDVARPGSVRQGDLALQVLVKAGVFDATAAWEATVATRDSTLPLEDAGSGWP